MAKWWIGVNYVVEDCTLYVSIRFKDKTDFSLYFYPRIITGRRGELCDSTTDDFDVIRLYVKERSWTSELSGTLGSDIVKVNKGMGNLFDLENGITAGVLG